MDLLKKKPTLHLLVLSFIGLMLKGLFHTCVTSKYSHCAFTGKVLRFSKMMKMYGYHVIEYGNVEYLYFFSKDF